MSAWATSFVTGWLATPWLGTPWLGTPWLGTSWLAWGVALVLGYGLGAIPFGLLLTRLAGLGDVRKIGSGNIGATNVLRTGHKGIALLTLLGDIGKGTLGALLGGALAGPEGAIAGGLGAFLGHLYSFWLAFEGGKGVATFIGVLIAWLPLAAIVFCAIWLGVAVLTRYSSLAALLASLSAPLLIGWHMGGPGLVIVLAMTALLYYRHRANIARLFKGAESRIGD